MSLHVLSFAKVISLRPNLAELVVNDGLEISGAMVDELHGYLRAAFQCPFSLLVNKINSYAYSFDAQQRFGDIPELDAVAVVAYSHMSILTTRVLQEDHYRSRPLNLEIFQDRETAMVWLLTHIESTRFCPLNQVTD